MRVGPFRNGEEARRNIRKESGKFRKGRKNTKTKIIISISHTLEARVRESIRKRRAVKVEKERTKNGALRNSIEDGERSG